MKILQEKKLKIIQVLAVSVIVSSIVLRFTGFTPMVIVEVIQLIGVFMGLFFAAQNYYKKKNKVVDL